MSSELEDGERMLNAKCGIRNEGLGSADEF